MFEPIDPHARDLWLHPIDALPYELRRKRTRYQLTILSSVAAMVVVLAGLGVLPAAKDSMALGLREELAGPPPKERAVQAYARGDYLGAQRALLAAAGQGDAEAQELLGVMYAAGHPGVPADPVAASLWLDRAAENGRPSARDLKCALFRATENRPADTHCF